jgi:hypothetical protein
MSGFVPDAGATFQPFVDLRCSMHLQVAETVRLRSPLSLRARTGGKGIGSPRSESDALFDKLCLQPVGLEARGFEPLTSSLQSWRSTN